MSAARHVDTRSVVQFYRYADALLRLRSAANTRCRGRQMLFCAALLRYYR